MTVRQGLPVARPNPKLRVTKAGASAMIPLDRGTNLARGYSTAALVQAAANP